MIVNAENLVETLETLLRGGKTVEIRHATTGSGTQKCAIEGIYTITYDEGE